MTAAKDTGEAVAAAEDSGEAGGSPQAGPTGPAVAADSIIVSAFESCELPAESFRHADHVRLARHYLIRLELPEALIRVRDGIRRYAASLGKTALYHETITFALTALIRERLDGAPPDEDWVAFAARNPDLLVWKPSALDRYYTAERLASAEARRSFVWPDRIG